MTKTNSTFKLTLVMASALSLSACQWLEVERTIEVPTDNNYSIATEDLVESLPEGLQADTENKRHTGERLRSNDE